MPWGNLCRSMAVLGFILLTPAAFAQRGFSAVAFLTQPPNQSNGSLSDSHCNLCPVPQRSVAEDFVVSTGGVGINIEDLTFWGGYVPGNSNLPDSITIRIMSDSGGLPNTGNVVCSASGVAPSKFQTGMIVQGVNEWEYATPFSCSLSDGTYHIEIFNNSSPSTDDWIWELGDQDPTNGIPLSSFAFETPGVTWFRAIGGDLAIVIDGELVPVELESFEIEK